MKKLLFGILAVIVVFSLVACGEKPEEPVTSGEVVVEPVVETSGEVEPVAPVEESGEQIGVGNTDASMVALALERYYMDSSDEIEEVIPTNIRVYTAEEIEADEAIKSHDIKEGDIVFDVEYELKIKDGVEDLMKYTAGTGEIDGQMIRNKANCGIARNHGEDGYIIDGLETGF